MAWELLLALPVVFMIFIYWRNNSKFNKLPPGPSSLPVIGNLLQMRDLVGSIRKWKKEYGDTLTFFMGSRPMVVMHDLHTVRKVFAMEETAGRDQQFSFNFFKGKGLTFSQGELWKEHRRFALSTLRDLGMGKTFLEDNIIGEAEDMCKVLREQNSKPIDPKTLMSHSVSNVICSLVFGKRFAHSDEKFTRLTSLLSENIQIVGSDNPVFTVLPFLKYIPGHVKNNYKKICQNVADLSQFTNALIKEHASDVSADDEDARDYIDAFLHEAQKEQNHKTTFDDVQLLASVLNLFAAGTETTSTSLLWSFVFMVEHPEIMQKVQEEIDASVGNDPVIRMDHKTKLPYTEAVILEVQRCASLVPLGVVHQVLEEIQVDGYTLPAGTLLAANLFSIHMDERYWDRPMEFDPGHFLDTEGKLKKPEGLVSFSVGKRACLGESLARMELYLFFANLLRNFRLKNVPGRQISHLNKITGFVQSPKPYDIIFEPRRYWCLSNCAD